MKYTIWKTTQERFEVEAETPSAANELVRQGKAGTPTAHRENYNASGVTKPVIPLKSPIDQTTAAQQLKAQQDAK